MADVREEGSRGSYSLGGSQRCDYPNGVSQGQGEPFSQQREQKPWASRVPSISNPAGNMEVLVLTIKHQGSQEG